MISPRQMVRKSPARTLIVSAIILLVAQLIMSSDAYRNFSVAMVFFVFAFKSWVNFVFSITTHRQRGQTRLSIAIERYFWALLAQSMMFSVLFMVAFLDIAGAFSGDWVIFRNMLRSGAVISVLAVIIYGYQTLTALMAYLRTEAGIEE